jgi:hypothetical protein
VVADAQGRFTFAGLVPGDYHAVVPRTFGGSADSDAVTQFVAHAETITVERGSTKTVTLRLSDPAK